MGVGLKTVYVCSPLRGRTNGDVEKNISKAKEYCRFAVAKDYAPFAPHVFYTSFLDDRDEHERNVGMEAGIAWLNRCDELWVFSDGPYGLSVGMKQEIAEVKRQNHYAKHIKPIKYFNSKLEMYHMEVM